MAAPDLSFIRPNVALEEMRPVDHRRLVAILNATLEKKANLLKEIAKRGEESLLAAERTLDSTEAKLSFLESKLQHVKVDEVAETAVVVATATSIPPVRAFSQISPSTEEHVKVTEKPGEEERVERRAVVEEKEQGRGSGVRARDDPTYAKFFLMLKMGVPEQAVRLKMQSEGLDPLILATPDAITAAKIEDNEDDDEDSSDSIASFSDSD